MHPTLAHLHLAGVDRPINSYGVLIILGVTAGLLLSVRRARSYELERFDVLAVGLLGFAGGLVGASGLFIAVHWRAFVADLSLFKQPGMVFYGGLVGGALAAWLYARKFQVPLARVADAGAPGLALGHAFGRIGCLMGGCCYGGEVGDDFPLGVVIAGARRHPVQLYEAVGLAAIAVVLLLLSARLRPRTGALFSLYLGGYALLRLVVERFRGDDAERGFLLAGLLSTSSAIAALAFVAACALLLRTTRRRHG